MVSALLRAVQHAVVVPLGLAFGGWRLVAGGAGNEVDQIEKDDESEEIEEADESEEVDEVGEGSYWLDG
jgi:hypothetical protein